jgi:hypothetical protein
MDKLLSLLKLNSVSSSNLQYICDINIKYIDPTNIIIPGENTNILNDIFNGYGIFFDEYVITLNHIVNNENFKEYVINGIEYKILFDIDIYDIVILVKATESMKSIDNFLYKFNRFYENKTVNSLLELYNLSDNQLKIGNTNLYLNFIEVSSVQLKSKLYPSIPLVLSKLTNPPQNEADLDGISGSVIHVNNKFIGLLVSLNIDGQIEILPFNVMKLLIESYIKNDKKYYTLPFNYNFIINDINIPNIKYGLNIDKSISTIVYENDKIFNINTYKINENCTIYCDSLGVNIPLETYVLLCGKNILPIGYIRNHNIYYETISLNEMNFTNTEITVKDNLERVILHGLIFKQLSEEHILGCIHRGIIVPKYKYSNAISDKQIIILCGFQNISDKVMDILYKNDIDITKNVYRVCKISKKDINTLNDIRYHKEQNKKQLTIEFLNTDNTKNTVRINI